MGPARATLVVLVLAAECALGWELRTFRLLDHNGDGAVSLVEAAEGYRTAGQQAELWRADGATKFSSTEADLRDRWRLSCRRSIWSRAHGEEDPAGLVDCAAFGSRLRLRTGGAAEEGGGHQPLTYSEVLEWWSRPVADAAAATAQNTWVGQTPTAKAITIPGHTASVPRKPSLDAWILISSDWHVEPWFAGDAFNLTQPWMHGEVVRFKNASLSNMMTCADGATGLQTLPCNLAGNKDPPIGHAATHFEAFMKLHPTVTANTALTPTPTSSFFFVGDTQAHLMNMTHEDGAPEWGAFAPTYRMGPAVANLMTKILSLVHSHFAFDDVYWAAGNHDGPENFLFCTNDSSVQEISLAWV
eukprot:SAG31_NODE_7129_length_1781_cov_1.981570_2_plen_358_part_00